MEENQEENETQNLNPKDCDPALKPTEPQPGGSPLGKWDCDTKTGTYFWNDPQVAE